MGGNAGKIEEMLYNNEIDLVLIEGVIYNEELIKIPFSSYKLAIICSPKHKLALEEPIDINESIQERLLLREKGSAIRDVFDSSLLLHNIIANPEWIRPFDDGTGRKKEYILTETGKTVAENELERLRELTKIAIEIIGGNIK